MAFGGWEVGRRRRDVQGSKPPLGSGTRGWLPDPVAHNVCPEGLSMWCPHNQSPFDGGWQLPNWLLPLSRILGEAIFDEIPSEQAIFWPPYE